MTDMSCTTTFNLLCKDDIIKPMTFSTRLKEVLKRNGRKPAWLAKQVNVSRQTVSAWLSGDIKEISGHNLLAVADALKVDAHWLKTGDCKNYTPLIDSIQSEHENDILKLVISQVDLYEDEYDHDLTAEERADLVAKLFKVFRAAKSVEGSTVLGTILMLRGGI